MTKRLIHDSFFASVKAPGLAGKGGGGIESLVIDISTIQRMTGCFSFTVNPMMACYPFIGCACLGYIFDDSIRDIDISRQKRIGLR
ncbi:MAG: hypothetical protein LBB22_02590 [Treponema sp.]|nr:hypothetical protein [Treponema sp.]